MKYVDFGTINASTTATAIANFRCNGLFDPRQAAGGHQPLGFDQLSQLYDSYCVMGSRAKVTYWVENTSLANAQQVVFLNITNQTSSLVGTTANLEQPNVSYKPMGTSDGNRGITVITKNFSTRKWFTCKDPLDVDELQALVSADPASQFYFQIGSNPIDNSTDPAEVHFQIEIFYKVRFFDPKPLSTS